MHAVLEHATCCPADFSSCYVEQAKPPGLNTKQHRHKIFHKVKELVKFEAVCTFRSNSSVYCLFFFFLIAFMWKQRERMDIWWKGKIKSCPNHCIGHNPFPPQQHFSKKNSSSSCHVGSFHWLLHGAPIPCPHQPWCYAACAGCLQGVPRPCGPARTSHRHVVLTEVDCWASVSNTHNEISIWIVLIKLPVALNPGSIRCKWITINFAPFLRALYMHGQCRKNCSGYCPGKSVSHHDWEFLRVEKP